MFVAGIPVPATPLRMMSTTSLVGLRARKTPASEIDSGHLIAVRSVAVWRNVLLNTFRRRRCPAAVSCCAAAGTAAASAPRTTASVKAS